jgi:hypothetical protein
MKSSIILFMIGVLIFQLGSILTDKDHNERIEKLEQQIQHFEKQKTKE